MGAKQQPIPVLIVSEIAMGADFTGTVSEWYETLIETLNNVSAQIHRKTLRGGMGAGVSLR